MSFANQNSCTLPSNLTEYPAMASRTKTSGLRPVKLPREAPRAAPISKVICPTATTKTVNKTVIEKSPAAPRSFASIAASAANLPDPGAQEKKVSLISRPLKEKKKKQQDDYDIDPQDEWYASSSSDDECYMTDDDDDYCPPGDNDEEMWQ